MSSVNTSGIDGGTGTDSMAGGQNGGLDTHGQVNVAMTTQQLNVMTASLNDMSNPQSRAMWNDFGDDIR